jgi:hypothetical protein
LPDASLLHDSCQASPKHAISSKRRLILGLAIGIAAVGSVFFSRLAAGDAYPHGTALALSASAGIIGLALLVSAAFPQAMIRRAEGHERRDAALANQ